MELACQSRRNDLEQKAPSCDEKTFKNHVASVFNEVNELLESEADLDDSTTYKLNEQAQIQVVQGIPSVLEEMNGLFSPEELGNTTKRVFKGIPEDGPHMEQRLILLHSVLDGPVGSYVECECVPFLPGELCIFRTSSCMS